MKQGWEETDRPDSKTGGIVDSRVLKVVTENSRDVLFQILTKMEKDETVFIEINDIKYRVKQLG